MKKLRYRNGMALCLCIGMLFSFPFAEGPVSLTHDSQPLKKHKGVSKMINQFKDKLLKGDDSGLNIWNELSDSDRKEVTSLLLESLKNTNTNTRIMAAGCLGEIKTPEVLKAMAGLLGDPSEDVRRAALANLNGIYDKIILPDLLKNISSVDVHLREEIPLIIGEVGEPQSLKILKERLGKETVPEVKRNIMLAMARLGDDAMKDKFTAPLDVPDPELRNKAIEDLRYINDPKTVKRLLPALSDFGQSYLISNPNESPWKYARVCDAAVNCVVDLVGNHFSFKINRYVNYSPEEINEVKKYLSSVK